METVGWRDSPRPDSETKSELAKSDPNANILSMNFMLPESLLSVIVCPETHQSLRVAEEAMLTALNKRLSAGQLNNRGGELLTQPLEAGLVREDGKYLYPVLGGIPVMLIEEAIALP